MSLHILNLHCLLSSKQLGDKIYLLSNFFYRVFYITRIRFNSTERQRDALAGGEKRDSSLAEHHRRALLAYVATSPAGFNARSEFREGAKVEKADK